MLYFRCCCSSFLMKELRVTRWVLNASTAFYWMFEEKGFLEVRRGNWGSGNWKPCTWSLWRPVAEPRSDWPSHTLSPPRHWDDFGQAEVNSGCQKYIFQRIPYKMDRENRFWMKQRSIVTQHSLKFLYTCQDSPTELARKSIILHHLHCLFSVLLKRCLAQRMCFFHTFYVSINLACHVFPSKRLSKTP